MQRDVRVGKDLLKVQVAEPQLDGQGGEPEGSGSPSDSLTATLGKRPYISGLQVFSPHLEVRVLAHLVNIASSSTILWFSFAKTHVRSPTPRERHCQRLQAPGVSQASPRRGSEFHQRRQTTEATLPFSHKSRIIVSLPLVVQPCWTRPICT